MVRQSVTCGVPRLPACDWLPRPASASGHSSRASQADARFLRKWQTGCVFAECQLYQHWSSTLHRSLFFWPALAGLPNWVWSGDSGSAKMCTADILLEFATRFAMLGL